MTTATKTRTTTASATTGVLRDLEEREAAVAALVATERETGARATQAAEELKALHDERHRLLSREPGLFDHRGEANAAIEDNPVLLVDAALAKSPDVGDLNARYEHAKRLKDRAEQGQKGWARSHAAELAEALRPVLTQHHVEAEARLAEATAAVKAYAQLGQRFEVLVGSRVNSLEALGNVARSLSRLDVPEIQVNR